MPYPSVFLIHSATLHQRQQNFLLAYDAGTAVFHVGATLTGATSHATAIIVLTGSIASGSLQVHSITGTFLNDESISDNGTVPGAAVVNGVIAEARDINEELVYTDITATIICRYFPEKTTFLNNVLVVVSAHVILQPTTKPAFGDTIAITTSEFTKTFSLSEDPKPVFEAAQNVLSHWSCNITAAGATGSV
jgi:hypothetical protein